MILARYGTRWRRARKLYHGMLHVNKASEYIPYQSLESKQLLWDLSQRPRDLLEHLQRYSNSLTAQITYGTRTTNNDDPGLKTLFETTRQLELLLSDVTAALVDFFPALRWLPEIIIPAKKTARELYHAQRDLFLKHWLEIKVAVRLGTAKRCLSVDFAKLQEKEQFDDEDAAYLAGITVIRDSLLQTSN